LFTFYVRYNDAAGDDEKYVDPELGGDLTSPNGFNASNVRRIALNIYRATGRVEISSE
jgi:hypothetical protein